MYYPSVIPCVTDIQTNKTHTKGYVIIKLMDNAIQKNEHNQIKIHVRGFVKEKLEDKKPISSVEFTCDGCRMKQNGQIKYLISLITQESLLELPQSTAVIEFTVDIES